MFELPKLPAAVFTAGTAVNWDTETRHAIAGAAGADQVADIGFAVYPAEAGALTVFVRLTPGSAAAGA